MASLNVGLLPLLLLAIFFLLSSPVYSDDEEENLLISLNSYRAYFDIPILEENDGADCLAEKVAKSLEEEPCNESNNTNYKPYPLDHNTDLISKCDINITRTKDGVVLPVCVPDLDSIEVFTNYTKTQFAKYINSSKFAQVGLGSEGSWMVIVLSTNTPGGDFALSGTNSLVSAMGFGHCLVSFLLGILVYLAY